MIVHSLCSLLIDQRLPEVLSIDIAIFSRLNAILTTITLLAHQESYTDNDAGHDTDAKVSSQHHESQLEGLLS